MSFDWKKYPKVQRFLTASMHANSAPGMIEFTREPGPEAKAMLDQAEAELGDVEIAADTDVDIVYMLGYMADAGYSVTRKEDSDERKDVELKVYEILGMEY